MRSFWLFVLAGSTLIACRNETHNMENKSSTTNPITQGPLPEEDDDQLKLFGGGERSHANVAGGMEIPPSKRCTISRIGPRSYLTAGHCVNAEQAPLTGQLWLNQLGSSKSFSVAHRIRKVMVVNNSDSSLISDYAIVTVYFNKLSHEEDGNWMDARFTTMPVNSDAIASGTSAISYGWGTTSLPRSSLQEHAGKDLFLLGRISETAAGLTLPKRKTLVSDPADSIRSITIPKVFALGAASLTAGLGCGGQLLETKTLSNRIDAYISRSQLLECPVLPGDSGGPLVQGGSIIAINQGFRLTGTPGTGFFYESVFSRVPKDVILAEINRPIIDYYEILDEVEMPLSRPELYAEKKYKIRVFGANLDRLSLRLTGVTTKPLFRVDFKDQCVKGSENCIVSFTIPRPQATATSVDFSFRLGYERNAEKDGAGASGFVVVRSFEEREKKAPEIFTLHNVWDAKACPLYVSRDVRKPGLSLTTSADSFVLPIVTLAPEQPAFIPLPKVEGAAIFQKKDPDLYELPNSLVTEACQRLPVEADMCGPLWFGTDYVPGQTCSNYRCGLVTGYGCYEVTVTRQGNYFRGLPPQLEFALGLIQ